MPGAYVTRILDQAARFRGYPEAIRTDNGPEFTCRAFMAWMQARGIQHILIQPGKPTQNAYIESFNGKFRDECLNENWFESLALDPIYLATSHINSPMPISYDKGELCPVIQGLLQRALAATHGDLAKRLADLEEKTEALAINHDVFSRNTKAQLKQVFDALRELMTPPDPPKRPIGFVTPEDKKIKEHPARSDYRQIRRAADSGPYS